MPRKPSCGCAGPCKAMAVVMFLFTVKTTWTYYTEQSFKNAAEEGVCHIVDSTVREEDYVWSNTELGRVFV